MMKNQSEQSKDTIQPMVEVKQLNMDATDGDSINTTVEVDEKKDASGDITTVMKKTEDSSTIDRCVFILR